MHLQNIIPLNLIAIISQYKNKMCIEICKTFITFIQFKNSFILHDTKDCKALMPNSESKDLIEFCQNELSKNKI